MAKKIRFQTERLQIPAGTDAGGTPFRKQLDPQYDRATGYAVYVNVDPGVPVRIRVEDDNEVYQHATNVQDYVAGTNVGKPDRYTPCNIRAKGNNVTMTVELLATSINPLDFDFVYRLEREQAD